MPAWLGGSQVRVCCAQLLCECCVLAVALKRVATRLFKVNLSAYYCAKHNTTTQNATPPHGASRLLCCRKALFALPEAETARRIVASKVCLHETCNLHEVA